MAKTKTGKYQKWITKNGLKRIEAWARDGLIDEQICHNMGIYKATFYKWKHQFPEIAEALEKGKEVVDIEVENALLKRALGYTYREITTEVGQDGSKVVKTTDKEERPDTTAQIFWLKNRKPKEWREKREVEVSGELNNPYKELTQEQLIKLAEEETEYF